MSGVRLGSACNISATTPVVTAAACDVPDMVNRLLARFIEFLSSVAR